MALPFRDGAIARALTHIQEMERELADHGTRLGLLADYQPSLRDVLEHEGGNDDDPRDPGGRTSRGIIQSEWNDWRKTHPGLPADVWQAPDTSVQAIYRALYWDVLRCDDLPAGVDYAVFDYGVNSGIGRAARILQQCLGIAVDGQIGPATIAAAAKADPLKLINGICDERLAFLQALRTWPIFGRGWGRRVAEVRTAAIEMAKAYAGAISAAPVSPTPTPKPSAPTPLPAPHSWLTGLLQFLRALLVPPPPGATPPIVKPPPAPLDLASRIVVAADTHGAKWEQVNGYKHIFYIEGCSIDGDKLVANDNRRDKWNDLTGIIEFFDGKSKIIFSAGCTTEVGTYYDVTNVIGWGGKGAALIDLGYQECWQVGIHNPGHAHEALIQTGGEVRVYRDVDRSFQRKGPIYSGMYGINQHSTGAGDANPDGIGPWSAGCLVIPKYAQHVERMRLLKLDPRYLADHEHVFGTIVMPLEWVA